MSLTFILVDANSELSRHAGRSPNVTTMAQSSFSLMDYSCRCAIHQSDLARPRVPRRGSSRRRPWVDRDRTAQVKNILQQLGAGEKHRLAAWRRHDLQATGRPEAVKPHGSDKAGEHATVMA